MWICAAAFTWPAWPTLFIFVKKVSHPILSAGEKFVRLLAILKETAAGG
jgi:hypothetical protein